MYLLTEVSTTISLLREAQNLPKGAQQQKTILTVSLNVGFEFTTALL